MIKSYKSDFDRVIITKILLTAESLYLWPHKVIPISTANMSIHDYLLEMLQVQTTVKPC